MHSIVFLYSTQDKPLFLQNMSLFFFHLSGFFMAHMSLIRIACMNLDGKLLTEAWHKNTVYIDPQNIISSLSSSQLPMALEGNSLSDLPLVMKCS